MKTLQAYPRESLRYAFYLLPPIEIAERITIIHSILNKQFGIKAAGKFQVHATIKGFFLMKQHMDPLHLQAQLSEYLEGISSFNTMFLPELRIDPIGIGLNLVSSDTTGRLLNFRNDVVKIIMPFLDPDCDFAEEDLGNTFEAHVTLAFRDIPGDLYTPALSYINNLLPETEKPFKSGDFQFAVFHSSSWDGAWWKDLSWERIAHWSLT
jgi:2'-5' RNA ligase